VTDICHNLFYGIVQKLCLKCSRTNTKKCQGSQPGFKKRDRKFLSASLRYFFRLSCFNLVKSSSDRCCVCCSHILAESVAPLSIWQYTQTADRVLYLLGGRSLKQSRHRPCPACKLQSVSPTATKLGYLLLLQKQSEFPTPNQLSHKVKRHFWQQTFCATISFLSCHSSYVPPQFFPFRPIYLYIDFLFSTQGSSKVNLCVSDCPNIIETARYHNCKETPHE